MSMNITGVTESAAYTASEVTAANSARNTVAGSETAKAEGEVAATYEKGSTEKSATYTINKMSSEDRAALVSQLQADSEARANQLTSLVNDMMTKQAKTYSSVWEFLASGDFAVDAATKAQAQEDISEDGYWGVKQTSQRLFDFASALAGDDVDKMKEMQEAMMKGFDLATQSWGKDLPEISQQTIDAANKLFEDYYASKGVITEE